MAGLTLLSVMIHDNPFESSKAMSPAHKNHCLTFCLALLNMAFLLLPSPGWGEGFMRVQKKGVIYYYFSNRPTPMEQLKAGHNSGRIKVTAATGLRGQSNLEPLIREAGRKHKVPPALIKAVIRVESNFNPAATSPKGAQGLMQLMPGTADQLEVSNPYDAQENISGGTRYLRLMLEKFGFRLPLALAAYNAGPNRVAKCQNVPAIIETQAFVRDVCQNYLQYDQEK
jgi:soluble lytic murein transglycosylase-like protein